MAEDLGRELLEQGYEEVVHPNRKSTYYRDKEGNIGAKKCTKCREVKLLDSFYKSTGSLGGVRGDCKSCSGKASKKYRKENEVELKEWFRKYRQENKEKLNEKSREYYRKNKGKYRESQKAWEQENAEEVAEYKRSWYLANRDRLRIESARRYDRNKTTRRIQSREYAKKNPEKVMAVQMRRRARKSRLPNTLTEVEIQEIKERFDGGCALTGEKGNIHLDHVVPLSVGKVGTVKENIIPLRADLNNSKHSNNIFEWFANNKERFNLDQGKFDELIVYLSEINEMSVEEYRDYVYECFQGKPEYV